MNLQDIITRALADGAQVTISITPAARSQIMPAKAQKQERHTPLDEIAERRKLRVIQGGKAKRRTGT